MGIREARATRVIRFDDGYESRFVGMALGERAVREIAAVARSDHHEFDRPHLPEG